MNNLEQAIYSDINDEVYRRGYGSERLGSVNFQNDWRVLFLVALSLYLIFRG